MIRWIQITGCLFAPLLLFSQVPSNKERFFVEFDKGCAPFTVNVAQDDGFGAITRSYLYLDGGATTEDTTFTYTEAGTYLIIQNVGVNDLADKLDTLEIQVIESQRPEIEVIKCGALQVSIKSVDSFYDSVRVYFSDTDSSTLTMDQSTTYTFGSSNLQTISTKGLFSNADEVCEVYFEEILPIESLRVPEIDSVAIKEACAGSYTLYLALSAFQAQVNYRITLRQGTEQLLFDGFLDTTQVIIGDIPFSLDDYCVAVEVYNPCSDSSLESEPFCRTPTPLSLSPFESLFSSYAGSAIYVNLDQVSSGTFSIKRRFPGSAFDNRTVVSGSFNDPISTSSRQYFYEIDYIDSCGTTLYTAETHPPLISSELISDNLYRIQFEPALNSLNSDVTTNYNIGASEQPLSLPEFDLQLSSENGIPNQFLSAQSSYLSGEVLQSNTLQLRYEFAIHVPSAFTPNGDGLNDRLEFFGLPATDAEVKIFSKWGQLIYQSIEASSGWDGTITGTQAPEGTYLYEITFETETGKVLRQRGTFALINK